MRNLYSIRWIIVGVFALLAIGYGLGYFTEKPEQKTVAQIEQEALLAEFEAVKASGLAIDLGNDLTVYVPEGTEAKFETRRHMLTDKKDVVSVIDGIRIATGGKEIKFWVRNKTQNDIFTPIIAEIVNESGTKDDKDKIWTKMTIYRKLDQWNMLKGKVTMCKFPGNIMNTFWIELPSKEEPFVKKS